MKSIFLSASIPTPDRSPEFAKTVDTACIAAAVAALVHVCLGRRRVVWGGHPAITPMIAIIADEIDVDYEKWVTLYQSEFFKDSFPEDNAKFSNIVVTENIDSSREKSLEHLRKRMFTENDLECAVFLGGMEGIRDEYAMLKELSPDTQLYPLYSTGGATLSLPFEHEDKELESLLRSSIDYIDIFYRILGLSANIARDRKVLTEQDSSSINLAMQASLEGIPMVGASTTRVREERITKKKSEVKRRRRNATKKRKIAQNGK
jgi:hypothetical protein